MTVSVSGVVVIPQAVIVAEPVLAGVYAYHTSSSAVAHEGCCALVVAVLKSNDWMLGPDNAIGAVQSSLGASVNWLIVNVPGPGPGKANS
jgi:hypothetical protein